MFKLSLVFITNDSILMYPQLPISRLPALYSFFFLSKIKIYYIMKEAQKVPNVEVFLLKLILRVSL